MNVQHHFNTAEKSSSYRGILGESVMKDNPRKRSFPNRRNRSFAQEVEIINLNDLRVAPMPRNRARTERSSTPRKIVVRSTMTYSHGSLSQQHSKTNTAEPPATAGFIKTMT